VLQEEFEILTYENSELLLLLYY